MKSEKQKAENRSYGSYRTYWTYDNLQLIHEQEGKAPAALLAEGAT